MKMQVVLNRLFIILLDIFQKKKRYNTIFIMADIETKSKDRYILLTPRYLRLQLLST